MSNTSMFSADKVTRYALFAIVAAITFSLLSEWTQFSARYDEQKNQSRIAGNEQPITLEQAETRFDTTAPSIEHINQTASTQPPAADTNDNPNVAIDGTLATGGRLIKLSNDTIRITIDKLGGDIVEIELLQHLETLDEDAAPLKLLEKNAFRVYTAQSGLIGATGSNVKSARALFVSQENTVSADNGAAIATLKFNDPTGVVLTKTFSIKPGSSLVDVSYHIDNQSGELWRGTFYSQLLRDNSEDPGSSTSGFGMQSYLGTATTNDDSPYEKISFKDIAKKDYRNTQVGGWVAMIQHYFVSAWIPNQQQQQHFFTKKSANGLNIIGFYSDQIRVEPGQTATTGALLYAGPKDQYTLAELAKHLDLTVDYGWFWWLAQPLYAILYFFSTGELHLFGEVYSLFSGFNNWGIAIILLTVCVKAAFFKLSAASYRSMANMRRVQPKLLSIRERYGNDKQAQSKAMMELYQKEKINPLGGCLPILIQMPVFIALYWALMESVELRHSSFLWLDDLSVMDPYFILPIVMGATMWFQQRMNPAPPDPMQAKIMQWMPVMFTFFFLWFPSGLVIYWVSNNILSIAQQWVITHSIEKQGTA